jgi:FtsH-binding integral membrane protein
MISNKNRKLARINSSLNDKLSANIYNLILGACVLYGIVVNAIMVITCSHLFMGINPIVLIVGYFISCLIGTVITSSNNPIVSFIGYNLIVVPIGILLSVCLPSYALNDIILSIVLTGLVVIVMIGLSTLFPHFFAKLGPTLCISLLCVLVVELISLLLGFRGAFFDYIIVAIFSLYVGYDWHKAQMYPKTLDNAIDSAMDIYLDVINLFIRILSIISDNDD